MIVSKYKLKNITNWVNLYIYAKLAIRNWRKKKMLHKKKRNWLNSFISILMGSEKKNCCTKSSVWNCFQVVLIFLPHFQSRCYKVLIKKNNILLGGQLTIIFIFPDSSITKMINNKPFYDVKRPVTKTFSKQYLICTQIVDGWNFMTLTFPDLWKIYKFHLIFDAVLKFPLAALDYCWKFIIS